MKYDFEPSEIEVSSWSSKKGLSVPVGVQIVHKKTGLVVTCDSERSQHRNRHLALIALKDKVKGWIK